MERKLAAILAADVAGYSSLMEQNEAATFDALRRLRQEAVNPLIDKYRGRIFKLTGDGMFVEFASIVDAVSCAVEIQKALEDSQLSNSDVYVLKIRIGVHLGDVIVEDDDVYGDGVNIAARLEGLAEPGGIVISGQAFDTLERKTSFQITDLGQHRVKNIERPIRAYAVTAGAGEHKLRHLRSRRAFALSGFQVLMTTLVLAPLLGAAGWYTFWPEENMASDGSKIKSKNVASDHPTIVVLPLSTSGVGEDKTYFSDGLTDDLITDLSKVSHLTVIAQNSSSNYTDNQENAVLIGASLKATHVIKGSVRKSGEMVRINIQIVDANTGAHLWAERLDREFSNIFSLQDEVVEKVVTALSVTLTSTEQKRLKNRATGSVEAYDLYLRGMEAASRFTEAGNKEAAAFFRQAISKDPGYSSAYAQLATLREINVRAGWTNNPKADLVEATRLARKAIELDPDNPFAHWTLGRVLKGKDVAIGNRAVEAIQRAIELQPSYADAYAYLTYLYTGLNRLAEAEEAINKAVLLNPIYPFWYPHARGVMRFMKGDLEGAVEDFKETVKKNPTVHFGRWWLAAGYAASGNIADAEWEIAELETHGIDVTISYIMETTPIIHPPFRKKYTEALSKAGLPE